MKGLKNINRNKSYSPLHITYDTTFPV